MCNLVNMTRLICMKISGLRVCCNKREQTELVKKDAAAGRGVGNWQNPAKELNKSSCLKGVHKIQKGLHPVRGPTFHTEDLQYSRGLPILNQTGYEQEIKLPGSIFFCSRVQSILIAKNTTFPFFSTNLRPNPNSTGLSHVPTTEPLPKRTNTGKTNWLHYMFHGLSDILVNKLLYNAAKFLDYLV